MNRTPQRDSFLCLLPHLTPVSSSHISISLSLISVLLLLKLIILFPSCTFLTSLIRHPYPLPLVSLLLLLLLLLFLHLLLLPLPLLFLPIGFLRISLLSLLNLLALQMPRPACLNHRFFYRKFSRPSNCRCYHLHHLPHHLPLSLILPFMLSFPALVAAEAVLLNQAAVAADLHGPASRRRMMAI